MAEVSSCSAGQRDQGNVVLHDGPHVLSGPVGHAVFIECCERSGLHAVPRSQSAIAWAKVMEEIPYVSVAYTEAMMDYQRAYCMGAGMEVQDLSLILYHDNRPAGVWPLCLRKKDDWELGSNEGPVLPPLFVRSLVPKSAKHQSAACLDLLNELGQMVGATSWRAIEPHTGVQALNEWHCQAMRSGATAEVRHGLYVDLTRDIVSIKSCFRKSYKALITTGYKLYQVSLLDHADEQVWDEFRELHRRVAGRVTRSAESWNLQHQAVDSGSAFLVYLRDAEQRMVGGSLFHVSRDEGLYAVAAYDRTMFDKPVGHVVQYHAIQEMQKRGLKWYCLGTRFYPMDRPTPTPKEIAIAEFKEGFATDYFPCFLFSCPLRKAE